MVQWLCCRIDLHNAHLHRRFLEDMSCLRRCGQEIVDHFGSEPAAASFLFHEDRRRPSLSAETLCTDLTAACRVMNGNDPIDGFKSGSWGNWTCHVVGNYVVQPAGRLASKRSNMLRLDTVGFLAAGEALPFSSWTLRLLKAVFVRYRWSGDYCWYRVRDRKEFGGRLFLLVE